MQLYFPDNVFTRLLAQAINEGPGYNVKFYPASLITGQLSEAGSVGLIPATDLIKHSGLYVSSKIGISFEGSLCNSYIYYSSDKENIDSIQLAGDVSSTETLLANILFKELYNSKVKLSILTSDRQPDNENMVVAGDLNFKDSLYMKGISFAEEVIEVLSLPFVNYVMASQYEELLAQLNRELKGISEKIYSITDRNDFLNYMNDETRRYFRENLSSFVVEYDKQDLDGINQLLQLPYLHGLTKDMIDIKFVE